MSHVVFNSADLTGLREVPSRVRESLLDCGLPVRFDRFEVDFSVEALRLSEWGARRVLLLGETASGAVVVDCEDDSVCWLQAELSGPPTTPRAIAYRQFINSNLAAFGRCVEAYAALLKTSERNTDRLGEIIGVIDIEALRPEREGVWRDVLLDWDAGL